MHCRYSRNFMNLQERITKKTSLMSLDLSLISYIIQKFIFHLITLEGWRVAKPEGEKWLANFERVRRAWPPAWPHIPSHIVVDKPLCSLVHRMFYQRPWNTYIRSMSDLISRKLVNMCTKQQDRGLTTDWGLHMSRVVWRTHGITRSGVHHAWTFHMPLTRNTLTRVYAMKAGEGEDVGECCRALISVNMIPAGAAWKLGAEIHCLLDEISRF